MESKVFTFNNVSFSYRLFLADEHTKLLPLIVAFSSESNDHVVEKLISEEMQKKTFIPCNIS